MKVFLDMDGVITNFNKPVCTKFDLPYPPQVYHFFPEFRSQVNDFCDRSFWDNLEWMDEVRDILRMVTETFGCENIYLLTKIMPNVGSASGKMKWIQNNLPLYSNQVILVTHEVSKSLLAQSDTLIIEDNDKNFNEFVAMGGHGILVPRPWNTLYSQADKALQVVKSKLEEL